MSSPRELSVSHVVCNGRPGVFLLINDEHHLLLPEQVEFLVAGFTAALATARDEATRLAATAPDSGLKDSCDDAEDIS